MTLQRTLDCYYALWVADPSGHDRYVAELARQIPDRAEAERRLADLLQIPEQRCHISVTYRRFLADALVLLEEADVEA